ncbi:hypothetical protein, partial [Pseudomonas aeruginosa]|uniref:hypothetical protein n=1 Tax=Pseudomonas aeruginosa TaxID=287 RepID=UPI0023581A1C
GIGQQGDTDQEELPGLDERFVVHAFLQASRWPAAVVGFRENRLGVGQPRLLTTAQVTGFALG